MDGKPESTQALMNLLALARQIDASVDGADGANLISAFTRIRRKVDEMDDLPSRLRRVRIDQLRRDFQPSGSLDQGRILNWVHKMQHQEPLEPVSVCYDGTDHWLMDGFHRVEAAKMLGEQTIVAEVRTCSLRESSH